MNRQISMVVATLLLAGFAGTAQACAPVAGQCYQIPLGYTGCAAGSTINHGGYNYVTQDNGTMLLSQSACCSSYYAPTTYVTPAYSTSYCATSSYTCYPCYYHHFRRHCYRGCRSYWW
jgi:hypothetical protein